MDHFEVGSKGSLHTVRSRIWEEYKQVWHTTVRSIDKLLKNFDCGILICSLTVNMSSADKHPVVV